MRECGDCSLCCKLIGIAELNKPAGKWCQNACIPGGGCKIYEDRPPSCRSFQCGWLSDAFFGEHWRPTRAKMVVSYNGEDEPRLQIWVDPSNPFGWEKEPYKSDIAKLAKLGRFKIEIRGT